MTLEDDNKSEPETPTNSSAAATGAAASTSSNEVTSGQEGGAPDSTTKGGIKQKRSFDEISTSTNGPASDSTTNIDDPLEPSSGGGGEEEKMIIDDGEVLVTTSTTEPEVSDEPEPEKPPAVMATFKVVYAKQPYEVTMDLNASIGDLKTELFEKTGVTQSMQKLCFRGNLDDHKTLQQSGIKAGVKIMMIGSKMDDIKALDESKPEATKAAVKEKAVKEPLCQQKQHKKILEKGIPEYATPGWINEDCALPPEPLTGMVNKYGNKVRLTFKFESDEVWIGTKEHTQKLPMTNVKSVINEPVEGHPEYHLMGLQVGPTEASRIWFYWVPAQYVKAIKRAILND